MMTKLCLTYPRVQGGLIFIHISIHIAHGWMYWHNLRLHMHTTFQHFFSSCVGLHFRLFVLLGPFTNHGNKFSSLPVLWVSIITQPYFLRSEFIFPPITDKLTLFVNDPLGFRQLQLSLSPAATPTGCLLNSEQHCRETAAAATARAAWKWRPCSSPGRRTGAWSRGPHTARRVVR